MAGNEDLSFNPVRKEYYTVTEYDGDQYILAYRSQLCPHLSLYSTMGGRADGVLA